MASVSSLDVLDSPKMLTARGVEKGPLRCWCLALHPSQRSWAEGNGHP